MKRTAKSLSRRLMTTVLSLSALLASAAQGQGVSIGSPVPDFTHHATEDWLNSPPLTLSQLRGSVVLVDFWAHECWNCYRSFPWLNSLTQRYAGKGVVVVSVHTPELPSERARAGVMESTRKYALSNPIMLDNDYSFWNAMGNSYWPAYYLIDQHGILRYAAVGETHAGDDNARSMEAAIDLLLDRPPN